MYGNVPVRFGRGRLDSLDIKGLAAYLIAEALGAGLQVATPPLVEPDLGAADGGADGPDGTAGEAQGNGALARREFDVHGYLRFHLTDLIIRFP